MPIPTEQSEKKKELDNYLRVVTDLIEAEDGSNISLILNGEIIEFLEPILAKYQLVEIHVKMARDHWSVRSVLKEYSDEVLYALNNEIDLLDPRRRHRIFQTRIGDMTGYEYQAYLGYLKEDEKRGPLDSGR